MATYYINADSGDDATGDGSSGNPWETLAYAYDNSAADDTIVCQDSTASYAFVTDTLTNRTIQGESVGGAVFDGAGAMVSWTTGDTTLEKLVITNIVSTSATMPPVKVSSSTTLTISNCIFHDITVTVVNGNGAVIGTPSYYTNLTLALTGVAFYDIRKDAAATYGAVIGIDCLVSVYTVTLANCTFYVAATGTAALTGAFAFFQHPGQTEDPSLALTLKNVIIENASGGTLYFNSYSLSWATPSITYSDLHNITGAPTLGTGCITSDPLLLDGPNGDLRLRQGSPCIDTGTLT